MYMRKTFLGGLASVLFIMASITIIFDISLSYALDNIVESKALVPIIPLEKEYKNVSFI